VLVWHIEKGQYSQTSLDGLNVLGLASITGNIWTGEAKDTTFEYYIDERANEQQRQALQRIFSGKAGGSMAKFKVANRRS
jgi:hypothetical protein